MGTHGHRAAYQAQSGRHARRHAEPWTWLDDATLLAGAGTLRDRAEELQRTYYACANRLAWLRARKASELTLEPWQRATLDRYGIDAGALERLLAATVERRATRPPDGP